MLKHKNIPAKCCKLAGFFYNFAYHNSNFIKNLPSNIKIF